MKIILGTHYFYPHIGGIESVVESHAKKLSERGHHVTVISSDIGSTSMNSCRDGYKIQRYRAWNPIERFGIPYPLPSPIDARRRTNRVLKASDIDIIHVHGMNYLTTTALLKYIPDDCPIIMHQHTPFVEYKFPLRLVEYLNDRIVGRGNLRQADLVLCVSPGIEQYVQELEDGINTEVMTNGVDTDYFHPDQAGKTREFHCDTDMPVFFTLSRMTQKKGIDVLLETIQKIDQKNVDSHFAVAGDGPMRAEVEETAQIVSNMEVLGELSDDELAGCYAAADCFLFTSKGGEAFPTLTMIEAFASGTPVIASNLGNSLFGVNDGKNSILVEPGNSEELIEAIKKLVAEENRLAQMGRHARKTAERHFSIESKIDQLEMQYQSIISG